MSSTGEDNFDFSPIHRQLSNINDSHWYSILTFITDTDVSKEFDLRDVAISLCKYGLDFTEPTKFFRGLAKVSRLSTNVWIYEGNVQVKLTIAATNKTDANVLLIEAQINLDDEDNLLRTLPFLAMFSSAVICLCSSPEDMDGFLNAIVDKGSLTNPSRPIGLSPLQYFFVLASDTISPFQVIPGFSRLEKKYKRDQSLRIHGPFVLNPEDVGQVLTEPLPHVKCGSTSVIRIVDVNDLYNNGITELINFLEWPHLNSRQPFSQFLGHGAFGFVFKSAIPGQKDIAVKLVDISGDRSNADFTREVRYMTGKLHKHIVAVNGCNTQTFSLEELKAIREQFATNMGATARQLFAFWEAQAQFQKEVSMFTINMDLCGKSLREWICCQETSDWRHLDHVSLRRLYHTQRQILFGMICGVQFLHSKGIVHRDLRPENVLFSQFGTESYALPIKLGDFGLCRKMMKTQEDSYTTRNQLTIGAGNVTYRAPEACTDHYDSYVDYYSLGLTIWETLLLFPSTSRNNLFYFLQHEEDESAVGQHPAIGIGKLLITSMVKRNRQQREKFVQGIVPGNAFQHCEPFTNIGWLSEREMTFWIDIGPDFRTVRLSQKGEDLVMKCDRVKVEGGSYRRLLIDANDCHVMGFNGRFVDIKGDRNTLSELMIGDEESELTISGKDNVVLSVMAKGRGLCKIEVFGERNELRCPPLLGVPARICVEGNQCLVTGIIASEDMGLSFKQRYPAFRGDLPAVFKILEQNSRYISVEYSAFSTNCKMQNSKVPSIIIQGNGHVLENVECTDCIICIGRNIKMRNCTIPTIYMRHGSATFENCRTAEMVTMSEHNIPYFR